MSMLPDTVPHRLRHEAEGYEQLEKEYVLRTVGEAAIMASQQRLAKLIASEIVDTDVLDDPVDEAYTAFNTRAAELFGEIHGYVFVAAGDDAITLHKGTYSEPGGLVTLSAKWATDAGLAVSKKSRTILGETHRPEYRELPVDEDDGWVIVQSINRLQEVNLLLAAEA